MTKMSAESFVSSETKLEAYELKLIYLPSDDMEGAYEELFPCVPQLATETLSVSPVVVSWTKMSPTSFVSPDTRFEADEVKLTYLPSDEMEEEYE